MYLKNLNILMNFYFYIFYIFLFHFLFSNFFFYVYKFIKIFKINIDFLKKNLIIGNENGFIRIENKIFFIKKGEYILNGNNNDINLIIKSNNVILFFNNCKYNSNYLPTILIEKNIIDTIIFFNNTIISSKSNFPLLKLNKNSNVVIYANLLKLKSGIIISGENDYNLFINGLFFFKKNIIHQKGKLKINKDYNLYSENIEIIIKELIIQIHPFINNIDFNETIIQKLNTNFSDYLFNNIFNLKFLKYIHDLYNLKEKIIISMTSWKKRINKAHKSIEILINNSYKPDKVILNLAIEEFPKKNLELPQSILKLLKSEIFEIFWVNKNNNVFKKLIPTINRYKNDLIITIDDDFIYPFDLIENILKNYIKYGYNRPMSFGSKYSDWIINKTRISSHFGLVA